jgi:hypothetical protein
MMRMQVLVTMLIELELMNIMLILNENHHALTEKEKEEGAFSSFDQL